MKRPATVDEYIAVAPKEMQRNLKELRNAIRSAAPLAKEKISYGMPYYSYHGRLAYFGYAKKHVGFYVMPKTLKKHEKEVEKCRTGKATLQFPIGKKIPLALVKKLIRTGVVLNEK